jgi:hypothetical protein
LPWNLGSLRRAFPPLETLSWVLEQNKRKTKKREREREKLRERERETEKESVTSISSRSLFGEET